MNTIIEKIRAEIERLKKQLVRGACAAQIQMETSCKDEAYNEVLSVLDTLQEQPVEAEKIIRLIISILEDKHPNTFWRSNEMESGVYTEELVSFLSTLEKACEKPNGQDNKKEPLTFDGFVDKVGSWFANLKLRRFRKTFDGEIYPATELVQAYEWFVHELSEKYREKNPQEQPVCEGLEAEIKQYYSDNCDLINGDNPTLNIVTHIARHFYELGRQSKPEVCEGLEEEIQSFWDYFYGKDRRVTRATNIYDFGNIARHFAQWGAENYLKSEYLAKFAEMTGSIDTMPKNTLPPSKECEKWLRESLVSDDLEEAAKKYVENNDTTWQSCENCMTQVFKAGAMWQREQMMKEAVEVEVTETCGIASVWIKTKQFKPGQKVKLIIVKED